MRWRIVLVLASLVMLLTACAFQSDHEPVPTQTAPRPIETPSAKPPTAAPISTALSVSATAVTALINQAGACQLTRPPDPPFVPSDPQYARITLYPGTFRYGTDSLWTDLPADGIWSGLPLDQDGYTQKVFWWSNEYFVAKEPLPALSVTGRELDAPIAPMKVSRATNANDAMLLGVTFPEMGCWEITGHYKAAEIRFVVWVGP